MSFVLQPLAGSSLRNCLRLLADNRPIDPRYWHKAAYVLFMSALGIPGNLAERVQYDRIVEETTIEQPPVFIIGHWRSGTTYLHNLISQDPQFGCFTSFQAWTPNNCLGVEGKVTRLFLETLLPKKRPMDEVGLSPDAPQEEEFALGNLGPYSFLLGLYFPRNMRKYFDETILFEGLPPEGKAEWQRVYLNILKKASFMAEGKQLLLKNPANTGRIKALLEQFPDAKFVHIHRNPYNVYLSMRQLYRKLLMPCYTFHQVTEEELEADYFYVYQKLMQRFWEEKDLVPAENWVEVPYESLEVNAIAELERIYQTLQLPGYKEALPHFEKYTAAQRDYRKNRHTVSPETLEKVRHHCQVELKAWNYDVPESLRSDVAVVNG
jgi:omega-hydroxy-beta-dihydromenaquinone-9 sulfotransferase